MLQISSKLPSDCAFSINILTISTLPASAAAEMAVDPLVVTATIGQSLSIKNCNDSDKETASEMHDVAVYHHTISISILWRREIIYTLIPNLNGVPVATNRSPMQGRPP